MRENEKLTMIWNHENEKKEKENDEDKIWYIHQRDLLGLRRKGENGRRKKEKKEQIKGVWDSGKTRVSMLSFSD